MPHVSEMPPFTPLPAANAKNHQYMMHFTAVSRLFSYVLDIIIQTSLSMRHWVFIEVLYPMCVECTSTSYDAMNLYTATVTPVFSFAVSIIS